MIFDLNKETGERGMKTLINGYIANMTNTHKGCTVRDRIELG